MEMMINETNNYQYCGLGTNLKSHLLSLLKSIKSYSQLNQKFEYVGTMKSKKYK